MFDLVKPLEYISIKYDGHVLRMAIETKANAKVTEKRVKQTSKTTSQCDVCQQYVEYRMPSGMAACM